ncbi:hypothetical protein SLEP1_g44672 [Rubroshorea leprosula]|uniref:Uncharacterized protein n=1 Tax=Rubroshorea leprosula TaxID=152421 RepID=A0AAV5LHC2_9ROSI|nr:hypothetical protein SLEP1_g44672 [Rubroshorea leprosula]
MKEISLPFGIPSPEITGIAPNNMTLSEPKYDTKSFAYGFGYDPTTADYKLLKGARFNYIYSSDYPTSCSKVLIYSLKSNSWRQIRGCPFNCGWPENDPGILAENSMHCEEAEFDDGGVLVDGNVKIITASLISLEDRSEIDRGKRKQIVEEDKNSKNNKKRKNSQRNKRQEVRLLED